MSVSLGILLVAIALFAVRGYFKGFFGALSRALGLVAGYLAVIFGLKPVAEGVESTTGLQGLFVYLVAGLLLFVCASLLVSTLLQWIERLLAKDAKISPLSKIGGLAVGAGVGALLGFVVIYSISLVQEIRSSRTSGEITSLEPEPQPGLEALSPLDRTSRQLMGGATGQLTRIVYPEAAPLTAAFMESPTTMTRNLQAVADDQNLRALFNDKEFQALLSRGDVEAIERDSRFQELLDMPELRYLLQHAGVGIDGNTSDKQVTTWVVGAWQGVEKMRDDEGVQAIMNDPQFQKKLDSGDRLSLMTDPQLKDLMERFFNAVPKAEETR